MELAIFDREVWEEWARRRTGELEDQMFSFYAQNEISDHHRELIKRYYEDTMQWANRVPSLFEIMEDVYAYNSERTYEIAELEYQANGWNINDPEDSYNEVINQIQEDLESYYSDWQYSNLECYVEDILSELRLAYSYDECEHEHHYFDLSLSNCEIVVNDCQSYLFPEFMPALELEGRDILIL